MKWVNGMMLVGVALLSGCSSVEAGAAAAGDTLPSGITIGEKSECLFADFGATAPVGYLSNDTDEYHNVEYTFVVKQKNKIVGEVKGNTRLEPRGKDLYVLGDGVELKYDYTDEEPECSITEVRLV